MAWTIGIVLHRPEGEEVLTEDMENGMYASIAEIYLDDQHRPFAWAKAGLDYFDSVKDAMEYMEMIRADLAKSKPIVYPDDFYFDSEDFLGGLIAMCQVASDADDRIEKQHESFDISGTLHMSGVTTEHLVKWDENGLWEDAAMADNSGRCVFCDKTVIIRREMLNGEAVEVVECPHCGEAYITAARKGRGEE